MDTRTAERIHADHATVKRLGRWTTASDFDVHARRASVVLDLRSPEITGDLTVDLDLTRATVTLLVPEDAAIDQEDLRWTGRGRVKDGQAPAAAPVRTVRLSGTASGSEVRVHRGGVAVIAAMCSRAYLQDLRGAHRAGTFPTVDDPSREA